jgi:hypothetical protein
VAAASAAAPPRTAVPPPAAQAGRPTELSEKSRAAFDRFDGSTGMRYLFWTREKPSSGSDGMPSEKVEYAEGMEALRQPLLFRTDGFQVGAVGLLMPEGQKVARGSLVNNSAGELLPSHSEPVLTINGASSLSGSVHIVELKKHPGGAYVRMVV